MTAAARQPFGFTGREHDLDSGLVYSRARYLSPGTGAFLAEDPINARTMMLTPARASSVAAQQLVLEPVRQNRFVYAGANPVLFSDPTGTSFTIREFLWHGLGSAAAVILTAIGTMALSTAVGAGVRVANAMLFAAAMTFAIGLLVEGWQTGPSRWDPTDLAQNALGIVIGLIAFWWFVSPLLPESLGYAGMVSGLLVSVLGMPALIHVAHAMFGGGVAKSVCEVITATRHRP